jgi:aryl-alcohol dehydrogenase-like predicted oxidoreductase
MTTLPTRRIPALERDVSALGLGCMGLSWAYVRPDDRDEQAALDLLRHAADAGITFFDTSDVYGAGHNEQLLGQALAGRDDVVVATKAGLVGAFIDGQYRLIRNGRPDHLRRACEESLQRLGRDVIDLYYLHRVDPAVPLEESWGALGELVEEGKVRALGLSEVSVEEAEAAHSVHPVAAVQSELSLWTRDPLGHGVTADGEPAGALVAWARRAGAVFVPFSPLGRGFLADDTSEAPGDLRSRHPHFPDRPGTDERDVVEIVGEVAARRGASAAAVALAWVLARGEHVIPIPGTTKPEHLDANLEALHLELTPQDLADLDGVPQAVGGGAG